jgi:predicted GNAT superfamily acetyltransferase
MSQIILRNAEPSDFAAIVRLNAAEVQHTSAMDAARLRELAALACYHKVACVDGMVAAFLLAMRHDAPYENDNFGWFAARLPAFVHVDRIVVSADFARHRLGSRLYSDLFEFARANGLPRVTCEYNLVPANEPSRRFHDKFGFKELGTQWLANGAKQVSLQAAEV